MSVMVKPRIRPMLANFIQSVMAPKSSAIDPTRLSTRLRINLSTLSVVANLHRNTLQRNPHAPLAQQRLGHIVKIIARAEDMLGDEARAIAWFRFQPLAGFDRKTAEELVAAGQAEAVLKHLETLEHGGFA